MDELLAGAGMNGFLGVLDTPVVTPHLQQLTHAVHSQPAVSDEKVKSVVLKMEALMDLIEGATKRN